MPESSSLDRLKSSLQAIVRTFADSPLDYKAMYPAKVVSQSGNQLELLPDDTRIPPLSNVPMRLGVPGITATVAPGSRVLLGWAAGDPQKPVATLWESSSVTSLNISATTITLNGGVANVARAGVDTAGPWTIVGGNPSVKA
jgi:hypothetical protein